MILRRIRICLSYIVIARSLLILYVLSFVFAMTIYFLFVLYLYPMYYGYVNEIYKVRSTETAKELSRAFVGPEIVSLRPFPVEIATSIRRVVSSGMIIKIKVYDLNGTCVFSTHGPDVGFAHEGPDFRKIIETGTSYSKVVKKYGASLEGETVTSDVSETYAPVFVDGKVVCVFEVYSDVTHEQTGIRALANTSLGMVSLLVAFGWVFFTYIISRLAIAQRNRTKLEKLLSRKNQALNDRVIIQREEIEIGHQIAVKALASLAEFNDIGTGGHLNRIRNYVVSLATKLSEGGTCYCLVNNKNVMIEELGLASLLHDIGKVAIPNEILSKPGRLTPEEIVMMQKHTVVAGEILGRANAIYRAQFGMDSYLELAKEIALYHHERWDGKGYPVGLAGADIPLSARIVSVADVYDALRSSRPYKAPWTHEEAVREILLGRASQFDPMIVDAFEAICKKFDDISRK